jgi:hypothetical protein
LGFNLSPKNQILSLALGFSEAPTDLKKTLSKDHLPSVKKSKKISQKKNWLKLKLF